MTELHRNIYLEDFEIRKQISASKQEQNIHSLHLALIIALTIILDTVLGLIFSEYIVPIIFVSVAVMALVIFLVIRRYLKKFTKEYYVVPPYTLSVLINRGHVYAEQMKILTSSYEVLFTKEELGDVPATNYFNYRELKLKITKNFSWSQSFGQGNKLRVYKTIEISITITALSSGEALVKLLRYMNHTRLYVNDVHALVYKLLTNVINNSPGSFMFCPLVKHEDMHIAIKGELKSILYEAGMGITDITITYPKQNEVNVLG